MFINKKPLTTPHNPVTFNETRRCSRRPLCVNFYIFNVVCFNLLLLYFVFILPLPPYFHFSRFIINLPEEERSSFERLGFQIEQAFWFYDDFYRPAHPHLPRLNLRTFGQTLMHRYPPLIAPFGGNFDQLYEEFITYKHAIPVCGAIILNESLTKVNSLGF
jgi:hypothetical protein